MVYILVTPLYNNYEFTMAEIRRIQVWQESSRAELQALAAANPDWTQRQYAHALGLSYGRVSQLLRVMQMRRPPRPRSTLMRLQALRGTYPDWSYQQYAEALGVSRARVGQLMLGQGIRRRRYGRKPRY